MIDRRALLVAGVAWLCALPSASAQVSRGKRRIAYLAASTGPSGEHLIAVFRSALREKGWIEGDNLTIDLRYAESDDQRVAPLTAELMSLAPDVFVASTDRYAMAAASANAKVPVVFVVGFDPVGLGLVRSLAAPGRNVTGFSAVLDELNVKRLSLLKEAVPQRDKVGVLYRDAEPNSHSLLEQLAKAARQLGLTLVPVGVGAPGAIEGVFTRLAAAGAQALLVMPDVLFFQNRQRLADLALTHRLAAVFGAAEYVDAGALLAYGTDFKPLFKRAASLVDRILKGANPATIPVEQANVYELVVNLRTARALGIELPRTLMLQATRVIE